MKLPPLAVTLLTFAASPFASADESCCATPAPAGATSVKTAAPAVSAAAPNASAAPKIEAPTGHPLHGVIVAVLPEKSALLVKHEEIPGVMSAMTMLLKVDAATLASAKKDQAITATLVKQADGWWLRDVKSAEPVK